MILELTNEYRKAEENRSRLFEQVNKGEKNLDPLLHYWLGRRDSLKFAINILEDFLVSKVQRVDTSPY